MKEAGTIPCAEGPSVPRCVHSIVVIAPLAPVPIVIVRVFIVRVFKPRFLFLPLARFLEFSVRVLQRGILAGVFERLFHVQQGVFGHVRVVEHFSQHRMEHPQVEAQQGNPRVLFLQHLMRANKTQAG